MRFILEKDKDKQYIKNWRPISLLNVNYKIISKALASRFNKVLPNSNSPQQMAYVGRLIADIIEITDVLNNGFLVISVLKKFGFGNNSFSWIETLISKQIFRN